MSTIPLDISSLARIAGIKYDMWFKPAAGVLHSSYLSAQHIEPAKRVLLVEQAREMSRFLRSLFGRYERGRLVSLSGVEVGDRIVGIHGVYRVIKHVASGAMANIHEVREEQSGKLYALKTLIGKVHSEVVLRRFIREARILAALNHPNVISLEDLGWHENNIPFIVLELLSDEANVGEKRPTKFSELINSFHKGEIDLRTMLHYFADISDALDYFHNRTGSSVIHRDIKPANILVSNENPNHGPVRYSLRLADFGLSSVGGGSLTTLTDFHQLVGTPEYAPIPDMLSDEEGYGIDHRSDLYSLGIMLYLLITKKLPFSISEDSNVESPPLVTAHQETPKLASGTKKEDGSSRCNILLLIQKHRQENPSFDFVVDGIPSTLIALTHRLLAKHKNDRPQTAKEVSNELRRIADTLVSPVVYPVSLSQSEPVVTY